MPIQRQISYSLIFYVGVLLLGITVFLMFLFNITIFGMIEEWAWEKSITLQIVIWMGLVGIIFYERMITHFNLKNMGIASLVGILIFVMMIIINLCHGQLSWWLNDYLFESEDGGRLTYLILLSLQKVIHITLYFIAFYSLRSIVARLDRDPKKEALLAKAQGDCSSQMALTLVIVILMISAPIEWAGILLLLIYLFFSAFILYFNYLIWVISLRESKITHYNLETLGALLGPFLLINSAVFLIFITLFFLFFRLFLTPFALPLIGFLLELFFNKGWVTVSIITNLLSLSLLYGLRRYLLRIGGDFYRQRHWRLMMLLIGTITVSAIPFILLHSLIPPHQVYHAMSYLLFLLLMLGWIEAIIQISVVRFYRRMRERKRVGIIDREIK